MPEVRAQLAKMREFVTGVHQGRVLGFTGARFTDVVNIGIGGSDLGIVMATEALGRFRNRGIRLHCVSNVDGVELAEALEQVNPATTLFVICSKTFTTQETLANANAAREWLVGELGEKAVGASLRRGVDQPRGDGCVRHRAASRASRCGTGSAAATRSGRRSGCRSRWRWAWTSSSWFCRAATRWTSISARRRSSATCPC